MRQKDGHSSPVDTSGGKFSFESQLVAWSLIYWYCVFMVFFSLFSDVYCVHYSRSANERSIENRFHSGKKHFKWIKRSTKKTFRDPSERFIYKIRNEKEKNILNGKMMTCWHAWNVNVCCYPLKNFFVSLFLCLFFRSGIEKLELCLLTILASKTNDKDEDRNETSQISIKDKTKKRYRSNLL